MSGDILNQIDDVLESMERNAERFHPFGPERPYRQSSIEEVPVSVGDQLEDLGDYLETALTEPPAVIRQPRCWRCTRFVAVAGETCEACVPPAIPLMAARDRVRDRIDEAFRAEVLRQGKTECEIDGVRWIYRDGAWHLEPVAPLVDASSDTAPDVPRTKSKISQLAATLRARARRGGTR